jgi:guanylate kinase
MATAINEISHYREFDYLVVNDQFETALADLKSIVAGKCDDLVLSFQQQRLTSLINELLSA